jgi:translation elongation factor EF-1beta
MYRVISYIRVDIMPEDDEYMSLEEAEGEIRQLELMQPENIYIIEELDEEEIAFLKETESIVD